MFIKNKIIKMTYEKFSIKGYSTTLREIANASGLKKQSLYNYFESKEDLFTQMIEIEVKNHYNQQIAGLSSYKNLETIDQLEKIFMSIVDSYKDVQKLKFWKRLLLIEDESVLFRTKDILKKHEKLFTKNIREILMNLLSEKDGLDIYFNRILLSFMSLIHGVLDGYLLYGDEDYFDQYINDVWLFFWQGLQCYLKGDVNNEQ